MPEVSQLLSQVQWEVVAAMAIAVAILQFIGAVIHPVVFRLVTLLAIGAIIAIGLRDGINVDNPETFHAQALEMGIVIIVILISHMLISKMFRAMARAARAA
jgi:hypothetical protein